MFFFIYGEILAAPIVDLSQESSTPDSALVQDKNDESSLDFNIKGLSQSERIARLERIIATNQSSILMITQLQENIQSLQGQIDVLRHDIDLVKKQQATYYQDLNLQMMALEKKVSSNNSNVNNVANIKNTASSSNINQKSLKPETVSQDDLAYQKIYALLNTQKYNDALVGFKNFIKQYPSSSNIPNALYWQGEILLMQGKKVEAKAIFEQLIKTYPNHPKAKLSQEEINKLK